MQLFQSTIFLTLHDGEHGKVPRIPKSERLTSYIMKIRDRIIDFRRVPACSLQPHPNNWRVHTNRQRTILKGVLAEIGYADALLVRELPDGALQLVDGHLRAETTPNQHVPVLVLDLNDAEAAKLLATLDPIAALADTDQTNLDSLLAQIETENIAIQEFLRGMTDTTPHIGETNSEINGVSSLPEVFQIIVTCQDEEEQREVFEHLTAEGRRCRIANL